MGQSTPTGGSNVILIVEDEALVRFDAVAFFEDHGWQVHEAENADQAMAVLDRHRDIRVVMIDVLIPGDVDGVRLAHYVRRRYPPTLLFVTSGYDPVAPEALPAHATFFAKPFDLHRVLRQIEGSPSP